MEQRSRNNDYASRRHRARHTSIRVGDKVLVRDRHLGGKFQLPFKAEPSTVTAIKGTMITARRGEEHITRNVSQFKTLSFPFLSSEVGDDPPNNGFQSNPEEAALSQELLTLDRCMLGAGATAGLPMPSSHPSAAAEKGAWVPKVRMTESEAHPMPSGRPGDGRYHLRSNPDPSRRYAGYMTKADPAQGVLIPYSAYVLLLLCLSCEFLFSFKSLFFLGGI
ncbi:hypothetical protein NDU88_011200 [Pleurodeles waltl]|uniref:Uncharacterized protein n=1 Tax=Pleurodeles waltl TaxID=8319 RepID=A0AAV7QWJ5_PLEWA|nr:hypothetical protein NDU88_011200 [Pleurodeles waltl]